MKRYETMIVYQPRNISDDNSIKQFNELGALGWHNTSAIDEGGFCIKFYFQRLIEQPEDETDTVYF